MGKKCVHLPCRHGACPTPLQLVGSAAHGELNVQRKCPLQLIERAKKSKGMGYTSLLERLQRPLLVNVLAGSFLAVLCVHAHAQERSVARLWSEELIDALELEAPRSPVHARDLFHVSAAMYDAWAAYDSTAQPFLLGNTVGGYSVPFIGLPVPADIEEARETAISYAAFRLIEHRAINYAQVGDIIPRIQFVFDSLGHDPAFGSVDVLLDGPAALGNFIASRYIEFGLQDGANEVAAYTDQTYQPLNAFLSVDQPGNPSMQYPDRWQPLSITLFDQLGEPYSLNPSFLASHWGGVTPFALGSPQLQVLSRDGIDWNVYLDPGPPALLDMGSPTELDSPYKWGFCMPSFWQSHLDADDAVLWDTSPASLGNVTEYPLDEAGLLAFYDLFDGGDNGTGHSLNPVTGLPYATQTVRRGDHARSLAEFWSEGSGGVSAALRWFDLLHTSMDHPLFERRWRGQGPVLDALDYDVKAFFSLGGALHDVAIAAWSNMAYHDHVRPISAIRFMADLGQSSDPGEINFQAGGLPLVPGYIEEVLPGDPLAGASNEHVGKVKMFTYRGAAQVEDPATDVAGVGWILAQDWMPYQKPEFVSPPHGGYVSGSSAQSRAAARVLEDITGSAFFPGGIFTTELQQNAFLQNEMGPSETIELQWATYADAADACGLAQIWGGTNSPLNDMAGRRLGLQVGDLALEAARALIEADRPRVTAVLPSREVSNTSHIGSALELEIVYDRPMDPGVLPALEFLGDDPFPSALQQLSYEWIQPDRALLVATIMDVEEEYPFIAIAITGAQAQGVEQAPFLSVFPFVLDTRSPDLQEFQPDVQLLTTQALGPEALTIRVTLSEPCDTSMTPSFVFQATPDVSALFVQDALAGSWEDEYTYNAVFSLLPGDVEVPFVDVGLSNISDRAGNPMQPQVIEDVLAMDLRRPQVQSVLPSSAVLTLQDVGNQAWSLELAFDEPMSTASFPVLEFVNGDPIPGSLLVNPVLSQWTDATNFRYEFALANENVEWPALDLLVSSFSDAAGNVGIPWSVQNILTIDTRRPAVSVVTASSLVLADANAGIDALSVAVEFNEAMDTAVLPLVLATPAAALNGSLVYSPASSFWSDASHFEAVFTLNDVGVEVDGVGFSISIARDLLGNSMDAAVVEDVLAVDTRNPVLLALEADPGTVTDGQLGAGGLVLEALFDEPMDTGQAPLVQFEPAAPLAPVLVFEDQSSLWIDASSYRASYGVYAAQVVLPQVAVALAQARDEAGNPMEATQFNEVFDIQLSGVGFDELPAPRVLHGFPNPVLAGATFQVLGDLPAGPIEIVVLDALGRVVHSDNGALHAPGSMPVPLPHLAPGPYQLLLRNASRDHIIRFTVEAG